ncbi:MAG TPA: low molecular weight protein-tyrosine-phosphatase [Asticcacaulis sp.]|nr:low molecular weight protein-tyrosine-phosphatase [Asticcacaulis sp.]
MTAILFVCLGNICRSPLAEGIFRHQAETMGVADQFEIDSAGCGGWHAGAAPDRRSIAVAARHGVAIEDQQARKIDASDFNRFDLVLGLDRDNVAHLRQMRPHNSRAKIGLYLEEALGQSKSVPDPYYGGDADFEAVFALCERASQGLLKRLVKP